MLRDKFIPLEQWSPAFLAPGTGSLKDSFSTDRAWGRGRGGVGGDGSGVTPALGSDGEQQVKFRCLPFTSCHTAQFLTDCRLYWPTDWVGGDCCLRAPLLQVRLYPAQVPGEP